MIVLDVVQGEPDWFEARMGVPTASRFSEIVTAAKGNLSASARKYAAELVAERLGYSEPGFQSKAMLDGIEMEAEARRVAEFELGLDIDEVGLCLTDDRRIACSPDGLISAEHRQNNGYFSGIEIKCPTAKTHITYREAGVLPPEYKQQVHGSMAVTGLESWYFMSYVPGLPLFMLKVERDEYTKAMVESLTDFADKLDIIFNRYIKEKPNAIQNYKREGTGPEMGPD